MATNRKSSIIPAREPVGDAGRDPLTGENDSHERTDRSAGQVETMSALGFSVDEIALALNVRPGKLRQHYARELDTAPLNANMQVAKAFYDVAKSGQDWKASLSWLKNRAGWEEDPDPPAAGISININL